MKRAEQKLAKRKKFHAQFFIVAIQGKSKCFVTMLRTSDYIAPHVTTIFKSKNLVIFLILLKSYEMKREKSTYWNINDFLGIGVTAEILKVANLRCFDWMTSNQKAYFTLKSAFEIKSFLAITIKEIRRKCYWRFQWVILNEDGNFQVETWKTFTLVKHCNHSNESNRNTKYVSEIAKRRDKIRLTARYYKATHVDVNMLLWSWEFMAVFFLQIVAMYIPSGFVKDMYLYKSRHDKNWIY